MIAPVEIVLVRERVIVVVVVLGEIVGRIGERKVEDTFGVLIGEALQERNAIAVVNVIAELEFAL